jgi:restriction endonuclease-like protein
MKKLRSHPEIDVPIRLSATELCRHISSRNLLLAQTLLHESTFGAVASVLYQESEGLHGNFIPASYRRICGSPDWRRRLLKAYTASARVPRSKDRIRRELDCANSSDALLMNIFCYPGVTHRPALCSLLGFEPGARPKFGVRSLTPVANNLLDRTEIDMSLGNLFVEAKLTEGGFQRGSAKLVHRYVQLEEVFDVHQLPTTHDRYQSYQLIRGILAAEHCQKSFVVLIDGRRSDLIEAWFRVVRAVRTSELRTRLAVCTWQEIAACVPPRVQAYMTSKFGIS